MCSSDLAGRALDTTAGSIGWIVNPLVLPPIFFVWLTWVLGWPTDRIVAAGILVTAWLTLVPFAVLIVLVSTGRAESFEVRHRERRVAPYVAGITVGMLAAASAAVLDWPSEPFMVPLLLVFARRHIAASSNIASPIRQRRTRV